MPDRRTLFRPFALTRPSSSSSRQFAEGRTKESVPTDLRILNVSIFLRLQFFPFIFLVSLCVCDGGCSGIFFFACRFPNLECEWCGHFFPGGDGTYLVTQGFHLRFGQLLALVQLFDPLVQIFECRLVLHPFLFFFGAAATLGSSLRIFTPPWPTWVRRIRKSSTLFGYWLSGRFPGDDVSHTGGNRAPYTKPGRRNFRRKKKPETENPDHFHSQAHF